MEKVKLFLEKYNNSKLREKIKNVSNFLDTIVQKYIKAICAQFPVDEMCIDNLLLIDDFIVEPIAVGAKGHSGVLITDFDEKTFALHYKLKIFPNIDISYLENKIPNNLAESELDIYKGDAVSNIIAILHELSHSMCYIKFLKYDTEKNDYIALTKEDVSKGDYTYYVERGGLIVGKTDVHSKEKINELCVSNNFLNEAMTEFVAHNVLLDEEFQDLQYLHLSTGNIDPYNIIWAYSPFVNIIFVLNYLYNNAFSVAYFTGDTMCTGFKKDCLNVDIKDIAQPLDKIIWYFKDNKNEEIDLEGCARTLVNGIKKFLHFIEKTLEREDVKAHLNNFRIKSLNDEIQNICRCNDYINFILEKCRIEENDFNKLKQIFEIEFQNLKAIDVKNYDLNI